MTLSGASDIMTPVIVSGLIEEHKSLKEKSDKVKRLFEGYKIRAVSPSQLTPQQRDFMAHHADCLSNIGITVFSKNV